jgi:hypothetical protein
MKKSPFYKLGRVFSVMSLLIALSTTPTMASPFIGTERTYVCSQQDAYGRIIDVYEEKTYFFGFEVASEMVFEVRD